ncbi:unnamed protein product [Polarella glacialis]|uniref:14-3-3 domain-containing protein n=1 Tax=Polarella glacialis TaxID=89957 RepID=A0A813G650_POLGL|nr:unnamed protein product [Polarella glacialis]
MICTVLICGMSFMTNALLAFLGNLTSDQPSGYETLLEDIENNDASKDLLARIQVLDPEDDKARKQLQRQVEEELISMKRGGAASSSLLETLEICQDLQVKGEQRRLQKTLDAEEINLTWLRDLKVRAAKVLDDDDDYMERARKVEDNLSFHIEQLRKVDIEDSEAVALKQKQAASAKLPRRQVLELWLEQLTSRGTEACTKDMERAVQESKVLAQSLEEGDLERFLTKYHLPCQELLAKLSTGGSQPLTSLAPGEAKKRTSPESERKANQIIPDPENELVEQQLCLARLAEQAERYDDMVQYMDEAVKCADKISLEDRNLISVAYKNAVGSRRASWRVLSAEEQTDISDYLKQCTRIYRQKIETEVQTLCHSVFRVVESPALANSTTDDSTVFCLKLKGDYWRYIAEVSGKGRKKSEASENARRAYDGAMQEAANRLSSVNCMRLAVALNFSVFTFEVLGQGTEACRIAKTASDEGRLLLHTLDKEAYKEAEQILQLLRDNLTLWSDSEGNPSDPEELNQPDDSDSILSFDNLRMDAETNSYMAKLAEQAERYDDMVQYMDDVVRCSDELSLKDRNLLSVAYKNAVGSRRAAWRALSAEKDREDSSHLRKQCAKGYLQKVETELQAFCDRILDLLDSFRHSSESKIFFSKMKADYLRYLSEFSPASTRTVAKDKARLAYQEAMIAADELAPTDPIRLGTMLNFAVFTYEVLGDHEQACILAKTAFDDAIAELDTLSESSYKDSTLIMQLLRDNLTLWTSSDEE